MSKTVSLYAVTTVEAELTDPKALGYTPDYKIGQIIISDEHRGPTYEINTADQAARVTVQLAFVGRGIQDAENITYDRPVARLLALIQMGANGEQVQRDTLKVFCEDVREQVLTAGDLGVRTFRLNELEKKYTR